MTSTLTSLEQANEQHGCRDPTTSRTPQSLQWTSNLSQRKTVARHHLASPEVQCQLGMAGLQPR